MSAVVVIILIILLFFAGWFWYQSKYHRLHVVWDLDQTLLLSITPLEDGIRASDELKKRQQRRRPIASWFCQNDDNNNNNTNNDDDNDDYYFDIIDDDYPFTGEQPNTRTFWRPGARLILPLLRRFCTLHVHTAAQGSYTRSILSRLEPNGGINSGGDTDDRFFDTVIHRDLISHHDHDSSAKPGKDLAAIFEAPYYQNNLQQQQDTAIATTKPPPPFPETRCILLDDRVSNFAAQPLNGLHVTPYTKVAPHDWELWRMLGILLLCHCKPGDVRPLLRLFWSQQQKDWYPNVKLSSW